MAIARFPRGYLRERMTEVSRGDIYNMWLLSKEIDDKLRAKLRTRPRLQGTLLAPTGALRRLPNSKGSLYFPFTMRSQTSMLVASSAMC
jgi:hypothetical protein